VEAHREPILKTYEAEEKRLREAEKLAEMKKIEEAHAVEPHEEGLAAGMKLAEKVLVADDEVEEREEERMVKTVTDRKTKSQKNKGKRLLAEVCSTPCPSTTLTFLFVETLPGGTSRVQTDEGIH
jgi:nucleolar protein 53